MIRLYRNLDIYRKDGSETKKIDEYTLFGYLDDGIEVEEGFTLRDYFEFFKKYEHFQILDHFMKDYIKEFDQTCQGEIAKKSDLEYLTLNRHISKKFYGGALIKRAEIIPIEPDSGNAGVGSYG